MEAVQYLKHDIDNKDGYSVVLIPKDMLDFIKERLGNDVLWIYDEETKELTLLKRPKSYTEALSGLGADLWESVGGTRFISREREEWNE